MIPEPPLRATHHCRHYSYENTGIRGIRVGNLGGPLCARGVDLRTRPSPTRQCMPADGPIAPAGEPCPLREDYAEDERSAWKAYIAQRITRMGVVMAAIPGSGAIRDESWGKSGLIDCPGCGAGRVTWSRARNNGHLYARCSTPHCFSVIQ